MRKYPIVNIAVSLIFAASLLMINCRCVPNESVSAKTCCGDATASKHEPDSKRSCCDECITKIIANLSSKETLYDSLVKTPFVAETVSFDQIKYYLTTQIDEGANSFPTPVFLTVLHSRAPPCV